MKRITVAGLVSVAVLLLPQVSLACEKCFGAGVDNATVTGIGYAMLTLLVIVSTVFTGIGAFFVNMSNRAKKYSNGDTFVSEDGAVIDLDTID